MPELPTSIETAARLTLGVAVAAGRWALTRRRVTHRRADDVQDLEVVLLGNDEDLQRVRDGHGPVYHRRYTTSIRRPSRTAATLISMLQGAPNAAAPTEIAVFDPVVGKDPALRLGTDHIVRLPGPWNGPVRVVDVTDTSFRLATLPGHLEAGEIEFRAEDGTDGSVTVEIESWARSGDPIMRVLHHDLGIAQEVQLHMWCHVLRRVAMMAGEDDAEVLVTTRRAELLTP